MLNLMGKNFFIQFYADNVCLSKPMSCLWHENLTLCQYIELFRGTTRLVDVRVLGKIIYDEFAYPGRSCLFVEHGTWAAWGP